MDIATQTLLYRSEAFAEDVLDLVAARPVTVQAPTLTVATPVLRRMLRRSAAPVLPDMSRGGALGGHELPAV